MQHPRPSHPLHPEDPVAPDWATTVLPEAWPDRLRLSRPRDLWRLLRHLAGARRPPVELPEGLPGADAIPAYVLQEFHNLPNGNYSRRITRGYVTGFNRVMLDAIHRAHEQMAERLAGLDSVLDAGCGGGHLAGRLRAHGVADVWGIDPSPYLLQHAAAAWPAVRFAQGVIERSGFGPERFDAIAACFLFHELPPTRLEPALADCARILRPGGQLVVCEPSPVQVEQSRLRLWREYGWRGLYFRALARRAHEPFMRSWHRQDLAALLARHGLEVVEDYSRMPLRHVLARKA